MRIFSKRFILSAMICSRLMYPLYLINISAASMISSLRDSGTLSSSVCSAGTSSARLYKVSCGRRIRSFNLHPWERGDVPIFSNPALMYCALIE